MLYIIIRIYYTVILISLESCSKEDDGEVRLVGGPNDFEGVWRWNVEEMALWILKLLWYEDS